MVYRPMSSYTLSVDALVEWIATTSVIAAAAVLAIIVVGVIVFAWRRRRGAWRDALSRTGAETLLIVALALIVIATLLTPALSGAGHRRILLVPFWDLNEALAGRQELTRAIAEMVGNVLLFIPLGAGIALRWSRLTIGAAVGLAVAVSVVVEIGQAISADGRMTDVTDVLMNGIGAAIGALIVRRLLASQEPLTPGRVER
jgi:glycopeptide antibiotics resistance protein